MTRTPFPSMAILGLVAMASAQTAPTSSPATQPVTASLTVNLGQPAKPISPDLFGIFFEDINYAADGGLYPELVQNRSFDYSPLEQNIWNNLTGWEVVTRGGAQGGFAVEDARPLNDANPHYLVLNIRNAGRGEGAGVGIANGGFDGIPLKAGASYRFSTFARTGSSWGQPRPPRLAPLRVRLEDKDGAVLAQADITELSGDWKNVSATLVPDRDEPNARLVVMASGTGVLYLDVVSLMPAKTFKNHGLREDLAQTIADLHPKFIRFPGGCLAHGDGLRNIYRWKETIGPVETRKATKNIWRYHQTFGLGYFEYFQFCEDIGAKPLPVIAAGVSCQNTDHTAESGQQCVPMDQMNAYVQDILDLVEWANGPATSTWGARRAAAGHPEPFHLQYIGIGNEDKITPEFRDRFKMITDAVRAKYPEIVLIGTAGPSPAGEDFQKGWEIANELKIPVVDEHYYQAPAWFLNNLTRYDSYDRSKAKVYLGEYASRGNLFSNALAEAAYMANLERNGDVVKLASYAPLLARIGHTQWNPNLIYFNNTAVFPTVNYQVQKLYATNSGDQCIDSVLVRAPEPDKGEVLTASTVRDSTSGDVIVKLTNVSASAVATTIRFDGNFTFSPDATLTVLAGNPRSQNNPATPVAILPQTSAIKVGRSFAYTAPANSLSILRLKP